MLATIEKATITGQSYQEKMESILGVLEAGIKDIFTSGKFKEYLVMMSKFHNYSFRNTLLILMQRPDASQVAGFHTWHSEFGRSVNKGETGIRILAPYSNIKRISVDKKDSLGNTVLNPKTGSPEKEVHEISVQSFRIVSVFDVAQTSGKPLPELVSELKVNVDNADEIEKVIHKITDCSIDYLPISDGSRGYYSPIEHRIVIKEGMASLQSLKTLIHELAHSRLHGRIGTEKKSRSTMEVEAEAIAFTVLQFLGLDTSDYSFAYLASWSSNHELKELSASLSVIQKESDCLIKLIANEMEQ